MNIGRKFLLILLAGLIAIGAYLAFGMRHHATDLAARQKLDNMLGQADDETLSNNGSPFPAYPAPNNGPAPNNNINPQPNQSPSQSQGFMGLPIPNPMTSMGDSGVQVQESPEDYVLQIPLVNPADAQNVKVNVTAHHIEVSGNIGRREQNVTFTSSFLESFSTSQTVLPEKMTKKTEKVGTQSILVITVPKKHTNQPNLAPPPPPEAPIAPKAPENSLQDEENIPTGGSHQVI